MSTTPITALVNGHRTTRLCLHVPWSGAWLCDADFDSLLAASDLAGAATVEIAGRTFAGTFGPRTGSFQLQSKTRVVAGAGGMGTVLKARHYHSDAGIKIATVANDAVREAGETLGTSSLGSTKLPGVDFVRKALPASQVLAQVLGSTAWWIDAAGLLNIGPRAAVELTGQIEILDVDPRLQVATISTDDPTAVQIGTVLRSRLVTPMLVKELEIVVSGGKMRVLAWGAPTT